jgi:hypothetical protein
VRESSVAIDYDFTEINGQKHRLPSKAEVRMATAALRTRNLIDFNGYRKFSAESQVHFDHQR